MHILIVEDEAIIRKSLRKLLEQNQYQVSEAGSVGEASGQHDLDALDLIITDLRLPGLPGTELIQRAKNTPVLIMTSYASLRSAVDAMKLGAVDYIAKPFDHDVLLQAVDAAAGSGAANRDGDRETGAKRDWHLNFVGECPAMQLLYRQIERFAPTDTTILVQGETGTGKELVAQALHAASRRANSALISVNCAAIPDTLIESELFGYEKGAFTGATGDRTGLLEAAHGGTLFLDEIGELPMEAQARLLRFLQEGEIRPIGSVKTRRVDVRLIAATHRNLKQLAQQGKFRQDLFFRINVMELALPPLRQRSDDILQIARTFLTRFCKQFGKSPRHLSPRATKAIAAYPWPGNVRELQNTIERAVIMSDAAAIEPELFNLETETTLPEPAQPTAGQPADLPQRSAAAGAPPEALSLEDYFQRFVLEHQDSMSETELARKLGVSRKCLWERRQRLGIPRRKKTSRQLCSRLQKASETQH